MNNNGPRLLVVLLAVVLLVTACGGGQSQEYRDGQKAGNEYSEDCGYVVFIHQLAHTARPDRWPSNYNWGEFKKGCDSAR